jgi:glycyl-tRNA synthetase beta chain
MIRRHMVDLLFEIGTEEIPAGYIVPALEHLQAQIKQGMQSAGMTFGEMRAAATPRRMVVFCPGIPEAQESVTKEVFGPRAEAAYDAQGNPTKALVGFAAGQKVPVEQVKIKDSPKGKVCCLTITAEGRRAADVLPAILEKAVKSVVFPKSMRWPGSSGTFARPIRWIVAMLGDKPLPVEACGVRAGNVTRGHRFVSGNAALEIASADFAGYASALKAAGVIVDHGDRKDLIRGQILAIAERHGSKNVDERLLDEVNFLVECPTAVESSFDEDFLALPAPVLEAAMKEHQRYFPVYDGAGKLIAKFVCVVDGEPANADGMKEGHQRVLRARLSDARFFFEKDRALGLGGFAARLGDIVFLAGAGTMADKAARLEKLAALMGRRLKLPAASVEKLGIAARLCKADLLSEMVGEFPSLQGIMGREYALVGGTPTDVADAIREHYMPIVANGPLPATEFGRILSVAEKIDNIATCFALGVKPTGSADPFALRRQALGIIRIILASELNLSFGQCLADWDAAFSETGGGKAAVPVRDDVLAFFKDRLYQMFLDEGFPYDLIRAAIGGGFEDVVDLKIRVKALVEFVKQPFWAELVTIVERTYNIQKREPVEGDIRAELMREPEERNLWEIFRREEPALKALMTHARSHTSYVEATKHYLEVFSGPVHAFFDKVFVNVEDVAVKRNRMLLMRKVNELFAKNFADLSEIVTGMPERGKPAK